MQPRFTVTEFLEIANQTLDYAFSNIELEGEVSNFKISKGRWVFFDLKDEGGTVPCFMTVSQLRLTLEDGFRIRASGTPRVTAAGRFSFTVKSLLPLGEGTIKRAFELSRLKLEKEGLFDPARKRPLPKDIVRIGVISSITAAGYKDFLKILSARWSGLALLVANCGVQGASALPGLLSALDYLNSSTDVDVITILRGGGSPDDLAIFNDESLARAVASSRIPIITGIGHEVDTTLTDLAADVRASTPSNAAELLSKDKAIEIYRLEEKIDSLTSYLKNYLSTINDTSIASLASASSFLSEKIAHSLSKIDHKLETLSFLNPETVLKRGYAILSGTPSPGSTLKITTTNNLITAEVKHVRKR